jgi:hypothetical protein
MKRAVVPVVPCHYSPTGIAAASEDGKSCTCTFIQLSGAQFEVIRDIKKGDEHRSHLVWQRSVHPTTLKSLLAMNLVEVQGESFNKYLRLTPAGESASKWNPR